MSVLVLILVLELVPALALALAPALALVLVLVPVPVPMPILVLVLVLVLVLELMEKRMGAILCTMCLSTCNLIKHYNRATRWMICDTEHDMCVFTYVYVDVPIYPYCCVNCVHVVCVYAYVFVDGHNYSVFH
jgi:hypothetical protein